MRDLTLLVVDDDELVIQSVKLALPEPWRMMAAQDPEHLPERGFHAALVDMHLSGNLAHAEGVDVIRRLSSRNPNLEIIAMSGNLDRDLMESCLRAGASRFLAKPLQLEELKLTLAKIESLFLLQAAAGRANLSGRTWVGTSATSREIRRQLAALTNESGPILIEGESGTGKEVCAQLIHAQQDMKPFVVINVASVPENLFESEFFGHVKGAFTGADQNKMGLAEAAHNGDLFLDEIEALAPSLQAKLLRFLETGEVRRIGAKDLIRVETRVIAATNRNLNQMVADGKFREDLLWRLSGKKILLPPLRARTDDVPDLVTHFLEQDKFRKKSLLEEAMQALKDYPWPGNVRELKRVCEQLILNSPLPMIRREDVIKILNPQSPTAKRGEVDTIDLDRGLSELTSDFEKRIISMALERHSEIDDVARLLKISRSSLYKKIKDYGIQGRGDA